MELRVIVVDDQVIQLNEVAQPTLERTLNGRLQCRYQLVGVGLKYQLQQTATEIGPIHSLPRIREQDLLDELPDMGIPIDERRPAAIREFPGEVNM
jgi:hypothetical protein